MELPTIIDRLIFGVGYLPVVKRCIVVYAGQIWLLLLSDIITEILLIYNVGSNFMFCEKRLEEYLRNLA